MGHSKDAVCEDARNETGPTNSFASSIRTSEQKTKDDKSPIQKTRGGECGIPTSPNRNSLDIIPFPRNRVLKNVDFKSSRRMMRKAVPVPLAGKTPNLFELLQHERTQVIY
jgi:hypothetical protein